MSNTQNLPADTSFYGAGWTTTDTAYDISYNNTSSVISGTQQSSLDLSYQMMMQAGVVMINGQYRETGSVGTYPVYCSTKSYSTMDLPNDLDDAYLVYPGYGFKLYYDANYTGTQSRLYYNTTNQIAVFDLGTSWVNGLNNKNVPVVEVKTIGGGNYSTNETTSIKVYYRGTELIGPFS